MLFDAGFLSETLPAKRVSAIGLGRPLDFLKDERFVHCRARPRSFEFIGDRESSPTIGGIDFHRKQISQAVFGAARTKRMGV